MPLRPTELQALIATSKKLKVERVTVSGSWIIGARIRKSTSMAEIS